MIKKTLRLLPLIVLAILTISFSAFAAESFPDLPMTGKLSDTQKDYLSLNKDTFTIADISADYLVVDAFSMYCPICQKDAPTLNKVYEAVSKADTAGKIKFIGIGLGNTPFEVAFYQKKYEVKFPIVWDEDYAIHKALGEVGTPTFYIVKIKGGSAEILYKSQGAIKDADAFAKLVLNKAGVK